MRRCVYCESPLVEGRPQAGGRGVRHAYDPHLGRLWEICSRCGRWAPVPLALRWEVLEEWEERVRSEGAILIETTHLALFRVGEGEVVRVGRPPLAEWGGWRYGTRLPSPTRPRSLFGRLLDRLPSAPLEGYDPYGLTGPMGGVGGSQGPQQWLASPFLDKAQPLTFAFASVPFAPECPSCSVPMPLNPWEFQKVSFQVSSGRVGVEARCAHCGTEVFLDLRTARPAIRMGLGILDSGPEAREMGEDAGVALERVGGAKTLIWGLGRLGAPLGEMGQRERVALGIALDEQAEGEALEEEWRKAEEIASIMDGELTDVPGFREFRARVLGDG